MFHKYSNKTEDMIFQSLKSFDVNFLRYIQQSYFRDVLKYTPKLTKTKFTPIYLNE